MRFLAPGFVAFTLLVGVPLTIHLVGRSRARPRPFAAFELLRRSERKIARRLLLERWLLLLLRSLAILAIPLILAKPFLEAKSDLPVSVGKVESAVLIIDDSLSMSGTSGSGILLDDARKKARQILGAMGAEAELAVVTGSVGSMPPVAELTSDRGRLERALDGVAPTYRGTDLSTAMKRAAQILQSATRAERRVYVLSDLAAHGFDADPPWAAGAGPELVLVPVGDARRRNRAVIDLHVEPAPQVGPRSVAITVEVASYGAAVKDLPITLRVDGRPVTKGLVDVPADGKAQKRFVHSFPPGASEDLTHELVAELGPDSDDDLPADDRRFARWETRRRLQILVVDGDPRTVRREDEVFYLETALRPTSGKDSDLDVRVVGVDELDAQKLGTVDVVLLCNVKTPTNAAALRELVKRGGGLFFSMGDNVDADAWNETLGDLLPQPLQSARTVGAARPRQDGERTETGQGEHLDKLSDAAKAHPALASLLSGSDPEEPFRAARFDRYMLVRPVADEGGGREVLLRYEGGAPALLLRQVGLGRVALLTTTVDRAWTDLPIQPVFLPLMRELVRHLSRAGGRRDSAALLVDERREITLGDGAARAEVALPSGEVRLFGRDRVASRRELGFTETALPGFYRVSLANGERDAAEPRASLSFLVNLDAKESDPRRLDANRQKRLVEGGGAKPGSAATPTRRIELWHLLGALLLAFLAGESILLALRRRR